MRVCFNICSASIAMFMIMEFVTSWTASFVALAVMLFIFIVLKPIVFVKRDEQLLLERLADKETRNGPGVFTFMPLISKATVRKATLLDDIENVIVTDTLSGVQRVESGPKLLFAGAYEIVGAKMHKRVLAQDEYIKILDTSTGMMHVQQGPCAVVLEPTQSAPEGKKKGISLKKEEFVRVTDSSTGEVRIEKGEKLVFPGPMEILDTKQSAWRLRRHEYIRLVDAASGRVRLETGEQIVFPTSTEEVHPRGNFAQVHEAVDIDDETAVLVQSKETGQQRLVQEKGLFFPEAHDEVVEVRKLIRVEPHEVVIVQDNAGKYTFHAGLPNGSGKAFFLPPYCKLVTMYWGSAASPEEVASNQVAKGTKSVNYKIPVTKIDTRSQYAFFEYEVRTSDNVALFLEGTIFWQVVDVAKMIHTTGDPKGDVWFHVRSAMIQAVSRVTLDTFMATFNTIVRNATEVNDSFYSERGVTVHSIEVTRYQCVDASTATVLQEIIQETTNRINRMQKQQSDNDVLKEKMIGQIEVEKQNTALIQIRCDNDRMRAIIEGESDGLRLAKSTSAFFETLSGEIPDSDSRLQLYRFFQDQRESTKRAEHLSTGKAQLFLTPQDVNLKVNV